MADNKVLRVAFLGAGNVVRGLQEYWPAWRFPIELRVVAVFRRSGVWRGDVALDIDLASLQYTAGQDPLDGADLVIDTLPSVYPDGGPATGLLRNALDRGIDVLTVNKGPLVASLSDLRHRAHQSGARFRYCIDGVFPAVNTAVRDLRGATLTSMRAAANSTANFVLSEMEAGRSFEAALAEARRMEITEPDPMQDIEGTDTAAKMLIMVNAVTNASFTLNDVRLQTIRDVDPQVAARSGRTWKQVGVFDGDSIWVGPKLFSKDDLFYRIQGTEKVVEFVTEEMGTITIMGGASGRVEMAAALTREILNMYVV